MTLSPRSVQLLDALAVICAAFALVPPGRLPPDERAAWQCLGVFLVASLVACAEVWRRPPETGRARQVFVRVCLAALPGLVAAVILSIASGPCEPLATMWNAGWALLPALPLGAAVGVLAGSLSQSLRGALFAICATAAAFYVHDFAWALVSVSRFSFDHLGAWSVEQAAGPVRLYLPASTVAFRVETLAWAAVLVAAAPDAKVALSRALSGALGRVLVATAALGALGLAAGQHLPAPVLALHLGGRAEVPGGTIHYDSEISAGDRARFEEELRFHLAQLAPLFPEAKPMRVFLHVSEARLRSRTGADRSAFAHPHLRTLHVVPETPPHSALRHELVHVLAASWSTGWQGEPGDWPFGGDEGALVEGLAEALGAEEPYFELHQISAAMRRLDLLPDARRLMVADGFGEFQEGHAYTAAGSFIRFLLDRHGAAAVRRLYGGASYPEATAATLEELAGNWEAFLDEVPVPDGILGFASEHHAPRPKWTGRCWREAEVCGAEASMATELAEAEPWYRRCLETRPDDTSCLLRLGQVLLRQSFEERSKVDAARALLRTALEGSAPGSPTYARANLELAHAALYSWGPGHNQEQLVRRALEVDAAPWVQVEAYAELHFLAKGRRWVESIDESEVAGEDEVPPFRELISDWWADRGRWRPLAEALLTGDVDPLLPSSAREALVDELVREAWREDDCDLVERLLVTLVDQKQARAGFALRFRDRCAFRRPEVPAHATEPVP